MPQPKKVAVFFGGPSPEHDVSIVTGLQVLTALDPLLYEAFPVYVTLDGEWLVGEKLRDRATYVLTPPYDGFDSVTLRPRTGTTRPTLVSKQSSLFRRPKTYDLDFVIPAFHGLIGEDGSMQGLLETAAIPYSGMRTMASAVLMNKIATKHMLAGTDIALLPFVAIPRPAKGRLILSKDLASLYATIQFPCCVKPANLGSSIGVAKAHTWDELSAALPAIFQFDDMAIVESFVQNLVEYNVAVTKIGGTVQTSAIERPKHTSELLDFKAKYMSGGTKNGGTKSPGQSSEGMLSLTRDINPDMPKDIEEKIKAWAATAFDRVCGTGAPRIDFLCNSATNEVWLNEINTCPGSFGYFLWEAAATPLNFSTLLDQLIAEGERCHQASRLPLDPTPEAARLFPRKPSQHR